MKITPIKSNIPFLNATKGILKEESNTEEQPKAPEVKGDLQKLITVPEPDDGKGRRIGR